MNSIFKILLWSLLILFLNLFGRYLYVVFFTGGYSWIKDFYIVVAGLTATAISLILFFTANYFFNKKRIAKERFSFNKMRIVIMFTAILLAFIGERLYLFISDYLLLN